MTSTTLTIGISMLVLHVLFVAYVLWRAHHPRLMRVCCKCKRRMRGKSIQPFGNPIPAGNHQSHGYCSECAPAWLRECGMSEREIINFVNKHA